MIQKFFEYKLSSEEYDSYYYIVLEENGRKVLNGLLRGELVGLKGIANHIQVINVFLSYQNDILLIMNKNDVDKINDIEKFEYYNVNYLTKDNLKRMKRVLSFTQSRDLSNVMNHIMSSSSMGSFKGKFGNNKYEKLKKICSTKPYQKLLDFLEEELYGFLIDTEVSSFDELVSIVKDKIDTMVFEDMGDDVPNYSEKMIRNLLEYKIIGKSSYYADEEEYIVNSDSFKIPEQSTIVLYSPNSEYIKEEDFNQLETKYKIKVIWDKGAVFPIIRHLNKIKTFDVYKKIVSHV